MLWRHTISQFLGLPSFSNEKYALETYLFHNICRPYANRHRTMLGNIFAWFVHHKLVFLWFPDHFQDLDSKVGGESGGFEPGTLSFSSWVISTHFPRLARYLEFWICLVFRDRDHRFCLGVHYNLVPWRIKGEIWKRRKKGYF